MEATLTRTKPEPEKVIENINMAIYKIPDPPKIEIRDPLLNILSTDAEDILKYNYVNDKVLEDKTIEQIKAEFNFDDIKDAFDNTLDRVYKCWKKFDKAHLKGKRWGKFAKNRGKRQTVFDKKNHIKRWKKISTK